MHARTIPQPRALSILGISAALLIIANAVALSFSEDRALTNVFFHEDRFLGTLTALVFLGAAIAGMRHLWASQNENAINRWPISCLVAFALLCTLDELSFGERLLQFDAPVNAKYKIDGVTDLIVFVHTQLDRVSIHVSPIEKILILGAAALLALVLTALGIRTARLILRSPQIRLTPLMILTASLSAASLLVSTYLNLDILVFRGQAALEKMLELNAAILLWLLIALMRHAAEIGAGANQRLKPYFKDAVGLGDA